MNRMMKQESLYFGAPKSMQTKDYDKKFKRHLPEEKTNPDSIYKKQTLSR